MTSLLDTNTQFIMTQDMVYQRMIL